MPPARSASSSRNRSSWPWVGRTSKASIFGAIRSFSPYVDLWQGVAVALVSMYAVDLGRLLREHQLDVEFSVAPDDALWADDQDLVFSEAVRVRGTAAVLHGGEVLVNGRVAGTQAHVCRRCLKDVPTDFEYDVAWYFVPAESLEFGDDGESRPIPLGVDELELGAALREELQLRLPRFVVCRDDCAGLCPQCGTDWNVSACTCSQSDHDPRWDVLRNANQ